MSPPSFPGATLWIAAYRFPFIPNFASMLLKRTQNPMQHTTRIADEYVECEMSGIVARDAVLGRQFSA